MERRDVRSIGNNYLGLFRLVGKLKQIGARDEVEAEATGRRRACESLYMIGSVESEPSLWWTMSSRGSPRGPRGPSQAKGWVEGKGKAKASVGVLAFWRFGFFYRTGHWNNAN